MKWKRSFSITIVCFILGITLALQYKSIYLNKKNDIVQLTRLEDLKDQIIIEKNNNDLLKKRNEELIKQNTEFQNAKGSTTIYEKNLKQELERAKLIAGLTDVTGSGIIIKLDNTDYGIVEEGDLLEIINELRASDTQAISVNDERIVAMTEIREAGRYIIINNKQILPPFEIKAIADPQKTNNALKMVGGVVEKLETLYKLKVILEKKDILTIPKVRDDGTVIKIDLLKSVK